MNTERKFRGTEEREFWKASYVAFITGIAAGPLHRSPSPVASTEAWAAVFELRHASNYQVTPTTACELERA